MFKVGQSLGFQHPPRQTTQRGWTLAEFSVGMLLSTIVLMLATSSVWLTQRSAATVNDVNLLHQQASNLMRQLGEQLRQAGAIELLPVTSTDGLTRYVFSAAYAGFTRSGSLATAGSPSSPVFGVDGANGAADTLWIAYQNHLSPGVTGDAQNASRDCLGDRAASQGSSRSPRIVDQYFVEKNELKCKGEDSPTVKATKQTLLNNVQDFQLRYLYQTPGQSTLQYASASAFEPQGNLQWQQVIAVEVCLHLQGDLTDNPKLNAYNITTTARNCQDSALPSDGHLNRVYRSTYYLRNQQAQ